MSNDSYLAAKRKVLDDILNFASGELAHEVKGRYAPPPPAEEPAVEAAEDPDPLAEIADTDLIGLLGEPDADDVDAGG